MQDEIGIKIISEDVEVSDPNAVINKKLRDYFDGKIVRNDLTKRLRQGVNVPVYVLEYLLGQYCSSDDEEIITQGMENVKRILADNFVRPDEALKILSALRERARLNIDSELERYILAEYGEEPFPYVWTEQDLSERIRGLISARDHGEFIISRIPLKIQRLRDRCDGLQNELFDLTKLYYSQRGSFPKRFDYLYVVAG